MVHAIAVYRAPMLERWDSTHALDEFPRTVVRAEDGDAVLDVLNHALTSLQYRTGAQAPAGSLLVRGHPVWLSFADPGEDPAVPRTWLRQRYYFGVDRAGRLLVQDWFSLDMTVGDLRRAGESEYLAGDWTQVVILTPEGVGGGEVVSGLVEFLQAVGFETTVGVAGTVATALGRKVARKTFSDRRARKVADDWHEHGVEGPWVLTAWVDTKSAWDAAEVAKRLGLSGKEAISLLEAMGYERSERLGMWTVGTSKKAIKQRQRWDKNAQDEWQRPRPR